MYIKDNIWHLHSLSIDRFFECQKDIHFKTQPGQVAKNATPRPPVGNRTRDPGSLDQRSTDSQLEALEFHFSQLVPVGS